MQLKEFSFEPFEQWRQKKDNEKRIGDYIAEIGVFSWGCNGNTVNTYCAALSCRQNPHNVFSSCIYREVLEYDCKNDSLDKLQKWYEKVCKELNLSFKKHIAKTYFSTDGFSPFEIYVAIARGDNREEYMAIGFSEEEAKANCIREFFGKDNHTELELNQFGYEMTISKFSDNHMSEGI